jgi:hypothetical protein
MTTTSFRRLLTGLDTVQVAYYLRAEPQAVFAFEPLVVLKEALRASKSREGGVAAIGAQSFLLQPYGSSSGYPLVLEHDAFKIECGEFNNPSFYVTYRSKALWAQGAAALHQKFMAWAESVGLRAFRPEGLSRVDFTFDYCLPTVDFDGDCVISVSAKDATYRGDRKTQTIQYGKGDVVLRIYDKIVEIREQSDKVWLFQFWGMSENVWRIEWQVRKDVLQRFGLRTFEDLFAGQGDLLRFLAHEHDSLRVRSEDSNRSRWLPHPLWLDLVEQIVSFPARGLYREIDAEAVINDQLFRLAVSLYGYHKRIAALIGLRDRRTEVSLGEAATHVRALMHRIHEPVTWQSDVEAKRRESQYGGG